MTKIDRYVLQQYLKSFAICFISMMGLWVVIEVFTNMEQFLTVGEEQGGALKLIAVFYSYRSALFFDRASALLSLVAAMFTITWIQRHNEMTALLAAGISRVRIVLPVIVASIVITLLAAVSREAVIPRIANQLSRRPQDLDGGNGEKINSTSDHQTRIMFAGERVYPVESRFSKPSLHLPRELDTYGRDIRGENAYYHTAENGRPAGYLITEVKEPEDIAQRPSLMLGDRPVIITPHDAPDWLEPDQCFVVSELALQQLIDGNDGLDYASTSSMIGRLHNPSIRTNAKDRVTIHARFVQPFLDITLLFLGLPLVVTRSSRNVFLAIGMCGIVVTFFTIAVIAFQTLGAIWWLRPAIAAWMPLFVFVPIAVAMYDGMRK